MFASIIVPVYNSQNYLSKCLDSLAGQSFSDFEVILVDDGSNDGSQEICLDRCRIDQRFKYIPHGTNKGASAARNTGLKNATGDYVLFLDNDDWWGRNDALKKLYETAKQGHMPDLICYPMAEYYANKDQLIIPTCKLEQEANAIVDFFDCVNYLIGKGLFYSSASGKAVKRSLIENCNIEFNSSLKHNEDTDWSHSLLCNANSIRWIDMGFYVYRRNSAVSQSTSSSCKAVALSLESIVEKHVQMVEKGILHGPRMTCTSNFAAYAYILLLAYLFMDGNAYCKQARIEQKRNAWLLNFDANTRVSYVRRCVGAIGFNATGHLLAAIMRRERNRIKRS